MKDISRYGLPVKIFYGNLLKMGITLGVKDGQLRVGGNKEAITPVMREEILKRADQLVELLTPAPSPEMVSHFGRLLTLDELKTALNTADLLKERVDAIPVNGGWLLVTAKYANTSGSKP